MASNLNSGPWKALKRERRRAFVYFYRGYRAYMSDEWIFAPPSWTDAERKLFRQGWEYGQRLAYEFKEGRCLTSAETPSR